jgi:hypothetical protein
MADRAEYLMLTGFDPFGVPDLIEPKLFTQAISGEANFFYNKQAKQYRSIIFPAWEFVIFGDKFVNIGLN